MSRTHKDSPREHRASHRGRRRNISVRGVRRETPDYRRLSRAALELARAQSEAEAEAEATKRSTADTPTSDEESNGR